VSDFPIAKETMKFCLLVCLLVLFAVVSYGEKLESHSFDPPFEEVDHAGQRIVGKNWRQFGSTVVNNNFIRLTPDRQSKKGAVWSRKALGVPEFSSILKFRISGQGKNFFGDGLAFWITDQPYYTEGSIHGFVDKFVGIGIIFDTFKNTESLYAHRDVTVIVNDGEKTYDMMTENVMGCNTNVRYHAERGDFSVKDASRAKIVLNQRR
jgi:mannose-binding lectin 2